MLLGIAAISALAVADSGAQWQSIGNSDIGEYFVDRSSLKWNDSKSVFSIVSNMQEKNGTTWLTTLSIDCKTSHYAYLNGTKSVVGKIISHFDDSRPQGAIADYSLPAQLKHDYCDPPRLADWQPLGSSNTADVYFDQNSIKQSSDGTHFVAETKVVPFDQGEQVLSSMAFDCTAHTFIVMQLAKVKNGQVQHVFDSPQPPTDIDKIASLWRLSQRFCGRPPTLLTVPQTNAQQQACVQVLSKLKAIEAYIQSSYDNNSLLCKDVNSSVQQVQALRPGIQQNACQISSLDTYLRQLQQVKCQ